MPGQHSWDRYFLSLAETVAANSKCLSRKVGAVLVRDRVVICTGYNGPPRGVPHCKPAPASCGSCGGSGRIVSMSSTLSGITGGGSSCGVTEKTCPVCLGEGRIFGCPRRAAGFGSGEGLHLCPAAHAEANAIAQAALLGIPVLGATLYMNFKTPCKDCLGILINAGIAEVVCTDPSHYDELSKFLLEHSSIKVRGFAEEGQQNDSDQAELGVDKGARGRYIKIH